MRITCLILTNQGSKDSCIYQLIEITHNIFSTFDCNLTPETKAVFLDNSKPFDKILKEFTI